ncbi:protein-ribulosamine 3-kinase, chloroplastic [Trifolium repens]|nr:protein-ribulosamine 3-kinase, chloroplastic [Trifolium repens]
MMSYFGLGIDSFHVDNGEKTNMVETLLASGIKGLSLTVSPSKEERGANVDTPTNTTDDEHSTVEVEMKIISENLSPKTTGGVLDHLFEAEALGLGAIYETETIRVGPLPTGGSVIIMEFIEFGGSRGDQSVLGRKLAEMHKAGKSSKGFGFDVENTIGSTPQINTWSSDWIKFYAEHRLGYQLQLALDQYITIYYYWQRLVENITPLFDNVVIEPYACYTEICGVET